MIGAVSGVVGIGCGRGGWWGGGEESELAVYIPHLITCLRPIAQETLYRGGRGIMELTFLVKRLRSLLIVDVTKQVTP